MASEDHVAPDDEQRPATRRELLERAGASAAAALGALVFDRLGEPAPAADTPRVAVVGAGLAGLTCAYRLQEAGLHAGVYEASDRVGGRIRTLRDAFEDGSVVELGGELIDGAHIHVWSLATDLGLELEEAQHPEGTSELLHVGGEPYPIAEAVDDLTRFELEPEDGLSAAQWIEENVPGGAHSRPGRLLTVACAVEHGADSGLQSAVNLRGLLDRARYGPLSFAPWQGTQRVAGGNDELATRMTVELGSHIHTSCELVALELEPGGGAYTLAFSQPGDETWAATADHVVLALPFSSLRTVDCTRAGFGPLKQRAIAELGLGSHSKLHLRFAGRPWHELGCDGRTLMDTGSGATWDATRGEGIGSGILAAFTAGSADELLRQVEPVLPGISGHWTGLSTLDVWPGSRSCRTVGQHKAFAGIESEREGNCHFAGEHTSLGHEGTIEGAVESGERTAAEILADLT